MLVWFQNILLLMILLLMVSLCSYVPVDEDSARAEDSAEHLSSLISLNTFLQRNVAFV